MSAYPNDMRPNAPVTAGRNRSFTLSLRSLKFIILVVILCGLSFYAGAMYQAHDSKTSITPGMNSTAGVGGFRGRARGGFGQVTALSSSSITVQNSRTGTSRTFTITGTTAITDANGNTATVSSIQQGDTVMVRASATNPSQAAQIIINPSFGSGQSPTSPTTNL